jgi:hypothetical protein
MRVSAGSESGLARELGAADGGGEHERRAGEDHVLRTYWPSSVGTP